MLNSIRLIFIIYAAVIVCCNTKIDKNNMSNKKRGVYEAVVNIPIKLNYTLYVPDDYQETDSELPLVLYLHGVGERGTDLQK